MDKSFGDVTIMDTNMSAVKHIVKGCIWAVALSLIFLVIFSILLTYTSLSPVYSGAFVIFTIVLSCLVGGIICGLAGKKSGLIIGGLTGIAYALVVYILSILTGCPAKVGYILILLLISAFSGAFGGIFGVNMGRAGGNRKHYR